MIWRRSKRRWREAGEIDDRLRENAGLVKKAAASHEKTLVDSAAAEAASNDAHAALLTLRQDLEQRRILLNKAIGFPPEAKLRLERGVSLPSHVSPPSRARLLDGLEQRRLDLLALKQGLRKPGCETARRR